jgi:YidC/Oxa1 family membrane protein insertase
MDKRAIVFVIVLTVCLFFVNQWYGSKDKERRVERVQKEQVQRQDQQKIVAEETGSSFAASAEEEAQEQKFYVLENTYQQLVFSNIGGALSEINLPFRTSENKESVVREIGFDRTLAKDYSNNDLFPSFPYQVVKTEGAVSEAKGKLGGYYPLVRRSILGTGGHINRGIAPIHYMGNIISEDPATATIVYKVTRFEKNLIEFEGVQGKRRIVKTYSFPKNPQESPYCFDLSVKIEGDARGLYLTTGIPEVELISGNSTPALKYRITRNGKSVVEKLDLPKTSTTLNSIQPDWVCNSNGFMGLIVDPLTEIGSGVTTFNIPGSLDPTRLSLIDSQYNVYPADKYPGYEMHLPLPVSAQTTKFRVFAGPFDTTILKRVDASYSNPATGYNPDYVSCQSFHGWFSFISEPFAQFLFILMKFFHKITFSWGISIILLTIVLRIMLYPLNAWSIRSTTRMQQISPQVTAIQEKYKKEPKRAQMEVMSLYREKGVNPLTGCLPLLIQMPFLIGMFDLLKSSFDLRGVSFIPGWIDNLTAPDVLFTWNYPVFFFGTQFHLLPILLGVVMYIQQKFASAISKNQRILTDQQKQQKFMGNIMVIVFTVMFYHFPSGLNIYWLSSMLLGILQQWYMTKRMDKKPVILSNKS